MTSVTRPASLSQSTRETNTLTAARTMKRLDQLLAEMPKGRRQEIKVRFAELSKAHLRNTARKRAKPEGDRMAVGE